MSSKNYNELHHTMVFLAGFTHNNGLKSLHLKVNEKSIDITIDGYSEKFKINELENRNIKWLVHT
jgi:ribonuclease HIII